MAARKPLRKPVGRSAKPTSKTPASASESKPARKGGSSAPAKGGAPAERGELVHAKGGAPEPAPALVAELVAEPIEGGGVELSPETLGFADELPVTHFQRPTPPPPHQAFHHAYRDVIVGLVTAGLTLYTAAAAAGVHRDTVKSWLRKAADGTEPYAKFARDLETARATFVATHVENVARAAKTDWKASAWLLERRVPAFNPKLKLDAEHTHKGEAIRVELYIPDNGRGRSS